MYRRKSSIGYCFYQFFSKCNNTQCNNTFSFEVWWFGLELINFGANVALKATLNPTDAMQSSRKLRILPEIADKDVN